MAYFVTGATGFIGRRLVERLLDQRQGKVYVLVRESSMGRLDDLIERWSVRCRSRGGETHPAGDRRPAQAAAGRRAGAGDRAARQDRPLLPPRRRLRHDGAGRAQHRRSTSAGRRTRSNSRGRSRPSACTTSPRSPSPASTRACSRRTCSTRARSCPRPTTGPSSSPSGSCASSPTCPGACTARGSSSGDSQTGEMDKIDGPVLLLQGDPARCASCCPSGCRSWAWTSARPTSCRSTGWSARSTTSRTSPTSTAGPST